MKPGFEELTTSTQLGSYLAESVADRYVVLRGRYRGTFLDTIPKGYIKRFVLVKLLDELTDRERELFEACVPEESDAGPANSSDGGGQGQP
jgi:hypothetical protein